MVPGKRLLVGAKDAVIPVYETIPSINVVPCFMLKVVVVRVNGSIGILKVAVTIILLRATPVALFAGLVEVTIGKMVAPVLKLHTVSPCKALPIKSLTDDETLQI